MLPPAPLQVSQDFFTSKESISFPVFKVPSAESEKTSYTVSYNGNHQTGGTLPSNQTKWYGESLTLQQAIGGLLILCFTLWNEISHEKK